MQNGSFTFFINELGPCLFKLEPAHFLHFFLRRRSRRRFWRARDGRVFFDVAGGRPGGKFRRIVFVDVGHDGFEDMQRDGGLVRGVFQSAGRPGLRADARALGGDGSFKVGDVRAELREKIRGQSEADELRGERSRVGLKGAGGIKQRLVAAAAGHEKFSVESRRAEQCERVRGAGDAKGVHVFEGCGKAGDLVANIFIPFRFLTDLGRLFRRWLSGATFF